MPNLAMPHPLLQQRVRRIEPPEKKKIRGQLVKPFIYRNGQYYECC